MSPELLEHAPPIVQVCYWIGLGASVALMSTVYKWIWRALGYFWNGMFAPSKARELPMLWRPPAPPSGPHPAFVRVLGEGDEKVAEDARPARKARKKPDAGVRAPDPVA